MIANFAGAASKYLAFHPDHQEEAFDFLRRRAGMLNQVLFFKTKSKFEKTALGSEKILSLRPDF